MTSIAVVDDEDDDADTTIEMVDRYMAEHSPSADGDDGTLPSARCRITRFRDGADLLDACDDRRELPFDLIFLDIEMPGIDGLRTAHELRDRGIRSTLVFTTKMAQYATVGYDVDAIGYLVKPLAYPAMAMKLRKALSIVEEQTGASVQIWSDDHLRVLDSRDIRYVEVLGHSVLYHTAEGVWKDWSSLKAVEAQLEPHRFIRSNRYCLVNLDWVTGLDGSTLLVDGERLSVSRSRKKPLMQALSRHHRLPGNPRTGIGGSAPEPGR